MVKLLRSSVELSSCIVVVFDRLNRSYLTLKSVDVQALPGRSNWTHGVIDHFLGPQYLCQSTAA